MNEQSCFPPTPYIWTVLHLSDALHLLWNTRNAQIAEKHSIPGHGKVYSNSRKRQSIAESSKFAKTFYRDAIHSGGLVDSFMRSWAHSQTAMYSTSTFSGYLRDYLISNTLKNVSNTLSYAALFGYQKNTFQNCSPNIIVILTAQTQCYVDSSTT